MGYLVHYTCNVNLLRFRLSFLIKMVIFTTIVTNFISPFGNTSTSSDGIIKLNIIYVVIFNFYI